MTVFLPKSKQRYQLSGPNPLVHPGLREFWNDETMVYGNWSEFAPASFAPAQGQLQVIPYDAPPARPAPVTPVLQPDPPATSVPEPAKVEPPSETPVTPAPAPVLETPTAQTELTSANVPTLDASRQRVLYFYQLENTSFFDSLYGDRRQNKLREKPISVKLLGEVDDKFKLDNRPFIESGVGVPVPGSQVMDPETGRRYKITECEVERSCVMIQVELEK